MKKLSLILICLAWFISCGKNKDSVIVSHVEKLLGSWKLQGAVIHDTGEKIRLPDPSLNEDSGLYESVSLNVEKDKFTMIKTCLDHRTDVTTTVSISSKYLITENEIEVYEDQFESKGGCEVDIHKGKYGYSVSNDILIIAFDPNASAEFIRQ